MNTSIIATPTQKFIYVQISFPVKTGIRSATFQTANRKRAEKFINRVERKFPNIWDVKMWIWGKLV